MPRSKERWRANLTSPSALRLSLASSFNPAKATRMRTYRSFEPLFRALYRITKMRRAEAARRVVQGSGTV